MSFSLGWKLFVLYPAVALALNPAAYEAESLAQPSDQQIAQWVKQLGDNDFAMREKASRELWLAGESAEDALEKALQNGDAEVVRRARDILDKFRWGVYPDTPATVVSLIQTYQSSAGDIRQQTLEKLLRDDPAGLRAVLKFSEAEKYASQRKALKEQVSRKFLGAYQRFRSADGDPERFDSFITFAYDRSCIPNNHFVAYWLLRGKLDEQIVLLRRRLSAHPGERRFAETLAYLQRAKGNWKEARAAAEIAKREDLVRDLFIEAGEWRTLAAHPQMIDNKSPDEMWAFRSACARLAGKHEDFEIAVRELLRLAKDDRHGFSGWRSVAHLLLLNDRPDEALALFAKSPDHHTELFELLCARRQYHEALALADQPRPDGSDEQQYLNLLKARTLYQLGEKERARALFVQYGERIKDGVEVSRAERLLAEEYRVGLKDLAFEHCARLKNVKLYWNKLVSPESEHLVFLDQVFSDRSNTAKIWWDLLRQKFADDPPAATLRRLRDLLEGKTEAQKVKQWIEEVEQGKMRARLEPGKAPASPPPLGAGNPHWHALADAALANGLNALAGSLLEKAGTSTALIRLGDTLADKGQWARAAEHYDRAWRMSIEKVVAFIEQEHGDPLPLYLAGQARRKMGQQATGDKLIEQSHQALLGDIRGRYAFLEALEERGHIQDARREVAFLSRISEPNSFYSGAASRRLGRAAANRKDYQKAADCYERSTLRFFRSTAFYNEIGSYLAVPALVHRLRAAHLIATGNYKEARRNIDLALSLNPGDENIAITLVPELERCGRKKEADALFDRCLEPHEKTCRDYPRCAMSHNSAAWLSACCRRNLDQALQHAGKAVELAPTHAGYLDTLAEVHFQRGNKDKAVALQKCAIELNPKNSYYRKQLKRLEAGDPSTERPPEND